MKNKLYKGIVVIFKFIYEALFFIILFWILNRVGIFFEENNIYHIGGQYPKPDIGLSILFYLAIFYYPAILYSLMSIDKAKEKVNHGKKSNFQDTLNYKLIIPAGLIGVFIFIISTHGLFGTFYLFFIFILGIVSKAGGHVD